VDANGNPDAIANGVTYLANGTGTAVGGEVGTGLTTGVTGVANSAANYANGDHAAATVDLVNGASTVVLPYNTQVADSLGGTAVTTGNLVAAGMDGNAGAALNAVTDSGA